MKQPLAIYLGLEQQATEKCQATVEEAQEKHPGLTFQRAPEHDTEDGFAFAFIREGYKPIINLFYPTDEKRYLIWLPWDKDN